jgi:hypothetical protein
MTVYAPAGCNWTVYSYNGGDPGTHSGVGSGYANNNCTDPGWAAPNESYSCGDWYFVVPNECGYTSWNWNMTNPPYVAKHCAAMGVDADWQYLNVTIPTNLPAGSACQQNCQCAAGLGCISNICGIPNCSSTSCSANAQCLSGRCGNTLSASDPYYNKCVAANYGNNCTLTGGCFATSNGAWNCDGTTCVGTTPPACNSPNVCCGTSFCPNGSTCASGNTCVSPACVGS